MTAGIERLPFTIPQLRRAYADGLRPRDVLAEMMRRIASIDDPGIFIHLADMTQLERVAKALGAFDPDRPLWGIPFAVKDNIDVASMPTTAACPAFAYTPARDSFVVARLREAGAIPVGKTNLDQFATGLVGVRTPYPAPLNALDPTIVPGGSSSGSAVAVAHGMVSFALGTDTAGSGRVPAALNNIVGLKPTLGSLSARGVVPACRTLDTISVFALTVADAWAVFDAAAAYDPDDAYARRLERGTLAMPPPHLRIGIPDAASLETFGDEAQERSFRRAAETLARAGASLHELDFTPLRAIAAMLYEGAWVAERHAAIEPFLARDPDAIHPVTRSIIGAAARLSATDAFKGFYRLQELKRAIEPLLAQVDLLCVPTIPNFCTLAEIVADPIGPNSRLGTYTNFVNLMDLCGLAVPSAARADGRPGSVTLLGAAGSDALLASVALSLEQEGERRLGATDWGVPPAPELPVRAIAGEIEIAVCGAHMSGMALNHELTSRGGRFLRATTSEPRYRLYALPGGPPSRPGLVRVEPGSGGPIRLEVWALPLSQAGSFLARIPQPLGLGTLDLADGTHPTGFLCEAIATKDALDITALGDWRAFIDQRSSAS